MDKTIKQIIAIYNESVLRRLKPHQIPKIIHTPIISYDESDDIENSKRYNENLEKIK